MKNARDFDLGDILSITTGALVSPRHMTGVYDILNFMSGDNLYTHQLPRVAEEAKPVLLRQHPQLAAVSAEGVSPETWRAWLQDQVDRYGGRLSVSPMTENDHEHIDPLSEAAEYIHPDKIVVVKI